MIPREEWNRRARATIQRHAESGLPFTPDVLRGAGAGLDPAPSTGSNGAAFTSAAAAGLIIKLSESHSSTPSRRGGTAHWWIGAPSVCASAILQETQSALAHEPPSAGCRRTSAAWNWLRYGICRLSVWVAAWSAGGRQ